MSILRKTATASLFVTYAFLTSSCAANPPQPIDIPENSDATAVLEVLETEGSEPTASRTILNSPKTPQESTDKSSNDNCFRSFSGELFCPTF